MLTAQNTLMQIIALAMKILGTKNESELLQALSLMSEVGRTKFIKLCQNIILTGNTSQESIRQALQLALQALDEGPELEYTLMAKYGKALNRYYFGGRVRTYDGNYMDLKKPVNKDQIDGKEAIGIYKGNWMYLNKDEVAVPKNKLKTKGYDGTAHINRAYHGMLLPKPHKYDLGGILSKLDSFGQSAMEYGLNIKLSYFNDAAAKLNSWIPGLGAPINIISDFLFNSNTGGTGSLQNGLNIGTEDLTSLDIEELVKKYVLATGQLRNNIMTEIKKRISTLS